MIALRHYQIPGQVSGMGRYTRFQTNGYGQVFTVKDKREFLLTNHPAEHGSSGYKQKCYFLAVLDQIHRWNTFLNGAIASLIIVNV